ncbi:MAG: DUF881 domain-containing protein [Nocardioidaceae bacterium]
MPDQPTPPDEATPSGRQRLREAMLRPSRGQVAVGVLLAGLGFAGVTQVRATEVDNTYAGYREQDLIDVFNTMTDATQRAQAEIARLEKQKRDLTNSALQHDAAVAQAQQDADTLNILAGGVPVHGPGIRITITAGSGSDVRLDSMLDTLQELRAAGAEAMEFNDDVRAVAQTSFAEGDGGILVGGTLLRSPFVIDVIGEPSTLESALSFPQGPTEQLEGDGATVEVQQVADVRIDSIRPSAD